MKHFTRILAALLALTFLASCTPTEPIPSAPASDAPASTEPSEQPTPSPDTLTPDVSPTPTASASPEPPTTPGSVPPWDTTPSISPTYDEYFAETIIYDYHNFASTAFDAPGVDYYAVELADGAISVFYCDSASAKQYVWTVPNGNYADFTLCFATNSRVYGVQGGTELVRFDWFGENRETLHSDPSGTIGIANSFGNIHTIEMADESCIFFLAGSETGKALYRLYMPDMTLDLLYELAPDRLPYILHAYSNREIYWSCENPEFYALYDALLADPESKYSLESDTYYLLEMIERDYDISTSLDCAFNELYGEYVEQEGPRSTGGGGGGLYETHWLNTAPDD